LKITRLHTAEQGRLSIKNCPHGDAYIAHTFVSNQSPRPRQAAEDAFASKQTERINWKLEMSLRQMEWETAILAAPLELIERVRIAESEAAQ
jgi:hypothetical protein